MHKILTRLIALLFAVNLSAQPTVVDYGTTNTFTANAAATNFSWTLDGIDVGGNSNTFAYKPQIYDVGTHYLVANLTFPGAIASNSYWSVRVRLTTPVPAQNYYVATNGLDSNPGTLAAPFRTLEKARDTVRTLSRPLPAGGVAVWLRGGTYYRTNTLMLTNVNDSGSALAPVVWRSYTNETAIISGGKPVAGASWSLLNSTQTNRVAPGINPTNILEMDVSAGFKHATNFPVEFGQWTTFNIYSQGNDGGLCELFYNGQRQYLARYPNHNLTNDDLYTTNMMMDGVAPGRLNPGTTLLWGGDSTNYLSYPGTYTNSSGVPVAVGGAFFCKSNDIARFTRWQTAFTNGGLWLQGYWRVPWQIDGLKIKGFDVTNRAVLLETNASPGGGIASKYARPVGYKTEPFWALNLLEEMDQPGEWAVDFNRKKIYFYAPGPLTNGSVTVSDFDLPLVQIGGASNIVFQSLSFEAGLAQGIVISNAVRNLVLGCSFRNMGNMSVEMLNGGTNGVVSCDMKDLAGGGVLMRGGTESTNAALRVPTRNYVVNNVITNFSRAVRVYAAAVDAGFFGPISGGGGGHYACVGTRVAHNHIAHSPHSAVLHASWDNIFEYNEIQDFQQVSDDLGAFYSYDYSYQHGNQTFRYNFIHDSPYGNGIDFDQDSLAMPIYGNVMNLNTDPSESQGYGVVYHDYNQDILGREQYVENYNNLYANTHVGARYVSPLPATIEGNAAIFCTTAFTWELVTLGISSNTLSASTQSVMQSAPNTNYLSDPGFLNLANNDMRLKPTSRIYADLPTFKQIPVEMIGLYNDEYRTNATGWSPFVTTSSATNITPTNAVCIGRLYFPQFESNTTVIVYFGLTDGGSNALAWQSSTNLGIFPAGIVSSTVNGLQPNTNYFFRFYATNAYGAAWAASGSSLVTPPPPPFTTFTNLTPSQTVLANAFVPLSGQVLNTTPIYPTNGEIVSVTINGVTQTAYTTNNNGSFSLVFNTTNIPVATGSYPITYAYAGSTNLSGTTNISTSLSIVPASIAWSGTSSTNFETGGIGGNWSDYAAPISDLVSSTAIFGSAPTTNQPTITISRSVRGLNLQSTNGGWRLESSSSALRLGIGAGGISSGGQSSGTNFINANLNLGANQNWQVGNGGTLLLTGSITNLLAGTNWQATINGTGAGGTVILSPSPGNNINLVGSNLTASTFQIKNAGLLQLGGDGVNSPITTSTNFVFNTGTNGFGAIGLNTPGKIAVNSGTWIMSDLGKNGTDRMTGLLEVNGGVIGFGGARYLAEGTIQINSGIFRVGSDTISRFSNGSRLALGSAVTTAGSVATMNVAGGFTDIAGGVGNTFGSLISTLFNQSGGIFQNGVTTGTGGAVTSVTIGGTGNGTTNNLTALTITDGTFISAGVVQAAGAPGPGSVNNFNFKGGVLAVQSFNAANLGSSPGATAVANQTNVSLAIGTLANYGGILAPGNIGVAGKTIILGNYAVSNNAATLAIDIGGSTQATAFQNGSTNHDFISISGNSTLAGNLNINLLNGYIPAPTNSFVILTNGGTLNGSFTNIINGRVVVTNISGGSFAVITNSQSIVITNFTVLQASFSASTNAGAAPLAVTFTDTSTGAITNWFWNFGDGNTTNTTAPTVAHTYNSPGTNLVTLVVSDVLTSSTNSATVTVSSNPLPPILSSVTVAGANLIFTGSNGTAGANYFVLTTTNLALAETNWTLLSTNQFGPGGAVNFTNPLDVNLPQSFFRLRLP